MLKRFERYMKVYSPSTDEGDGEFLGRYPISMSYRTSEEVETGDVLYTNVRYSAYGRASRSPVGGYKRGMVLESNKGERYRVLVPVQNGDMWIIKVERVLMNGEEEAYGRV